ncbi:ParA family protein [Vitreimonas sp.]|uniref:ParA family protein n=1 Tax=Vitreimonas sp. TaxID=3069702 RepID=UPI002ED85020
MTTKRIAVCSMKGGVGKSTTVMMLADTLTYHQGAQILVIDLDAQANCGQMLLGFDGLRIAEASGHTITHWVDCLARGVRADFFGSITTGVSGLNEVKNGSRARSGAPLPGQTSILASSPRLRFAELAFDHRHFNADDISAPRKTMVEQLSKAMRSLGNEYDYIIFDCPPGFTTIAQAALCVSDAIITPLLEDPVSLWSLKTLRDFGLKRELNIWDKERHRILFTRVTQRGAINERSRVRQDAMLAGFETLGVSIPDASEALRWSQRPDSESYRTFNGKYAGLAGIVEQLGKDVVAFTRPKNEVEHERR